MMLILFSARPLASGIIPESNDHYNMDVQLLEERTDFNSIYRTMELMQMGYVLSV